MSDKPIPRRVRFEVLRRDNHACRYCGGTAPDVKLTVDHVIPRVLGGSDDPTNLVTACQPCNSGKAATSPDEHIIADVSSNQLEWARIAKDVAEMRRADFRAAMQLEADFERAWKEWTYGGDPNETAPMDHDWRTTINTFHELSFEIEDLRYYIRIAMASKAERPSKWRYFCGCCWAEIRRRQEIVQDVVAALDKVQSTPEPETDPYEDVWDPQPTGETYYNPACFSCDGTGVEVYDDVRRECRCASDYPYQDWASR